MKVLVVGATGANAGLVVPELVQRGADVRALVRDHSRAEDAKRRGAAEITVGDLSDIASLRVAADGVDAVFHINPAFVPHEPQLGINMVTAAREVGVAKVTFSSVYHPSISAMANHRDKQPVEEAIYESGMTFTVLQPSMFMQNLRGAWSSVVAEGKFSMPYSAHAKTCWVDYRDVAEVAAIALTEDRLDQGVFELSSPGMADRYDIAALMSEALKTTIAAEESPADQPPPGVPPGPLRDGLLTMDQHYDRYGFPGGNSLVLTTILGREPRTLAGFFEELAAEA